MPLFWLSAMVDSGSWVAVSILASLAGSPLAKQEGNRLCLTYASKGQEEQPAAQRAVALDHLQVVGEEQERCEDRDP